MTFTAAITSVLTNYANFQGRAIRSEFWYWALFYFLLTLAIDFVSFVVHGIPVIHGLVAIISVLVGLFLLVPSLAVEVRRLHDLDKSGWWLFISFVPLVGFIILIVWFCTPGTPGANRFGSPALGQGGPMPMPVGYN